jgi:hypothetical protein
MAEAEWPQELLLGVAEGGIYGVSGRDRQTAPQFCGLLDGQYCEDAKRATYIIVTCRHRYCKSPERFGFDYQILNTCITISKLSKMEPHL